MLTQARAQDEVTTETFGALLKVANGTNVTVDDVNSAAWKQGVEFTSFTSVALTTKRKSSWSKANVTVTLVDDTTFTVTASKKLISSMYLNITGAGNLTRKAGKNKYFSSNADGTISGIFLVSVVSAAATQTSDICPVWYSWKESSVQITLCLCFWVDILYTPWLPGT